MIGAAKARVLPLPVAEPPIRSFPFKTIGIDFSCISDGFSNPSSFITSNNPWLKPSFANSFILCLLISRNIS